MGASQWKGSFLVERKLLGGKKASWWEGNFPMGRELPIGNCPDSKEAFQGKKSSWRGGKFL